MTDRVGLSLRGLPSGIALTSTEEGSGDTWRIHYYWELSDHEAITFIVSAAKVEGLVAQAEELAQANDKKFSLEEARRDAADTYVVTEILATINSEFRLASWRR